MSISAILCGLDGDVVSWARVLADGATRRMGATRKKANLGPAEALLVLLGSA